MRHKKQIIILSLLLFISSIFAQVEKMNDMPIDVDVAKFKASNGWTFLEVYFSFPRVHLKHTKFDNYYEATFNIDVNLVYQDSVVAKRNWKRRDQSKFLEDIKKTQQIYDITSFYLKPGDYQIQTNIIDISGDTLGTKSIDVAVLAFPATGTYLSDLEIAVKVQRDTSKTVFNKNGYLVVPNASGVFGIELPLLYYYCEIYNLSSLTETSDSTYSIKTSIHDKYGINVRNLPEKRNVRMSASLVEVGEINVVTLKTGYYSLRLKLIDHSTKDSSAVEKNFYVYRHSDFDKKPASEDKIIRIRSSEFKLMSEKELDDYFDQLRYTATPEEKKVFRQLEIEGKKTFLDEFWDKRDMNVETSENEFKKEYLHRLDYVNKRFGISTKKGYRTDRGRVLITYGEPNQIERFPSTMDSKSHEVWHFDEIEGGVIFVYIDMNGFGDFRLVHSTARSEMYNADWESLLE